LGRIPFFRLGDSFRFDLAEVKRSLRSEVTHGKQDTQTGDHVREPADMYFAYGDASVHDIKACAREANFTGSTLQSPLLTYMTIKSRLQRIALVFDTKGIVDKAHTASDAVGTLHVAHFVSFDKTHIGFFTVFDGDMKKYFQDFADKTAFTSTHLSHIEENADPIAKKRPDILSVGLDNNYPPIGFYSAYQASQSRHLRRAGDRKSPSAPDSTASHVHEPRSILRDEARSCSPAAWPRAGPRSTGESRRHAARPAGIRGSFCAYRCRW
jgi:hypothetical protein